MKLNSLIDNIRDSIVTGLGKKVSVRDKSLLNVLISDIGDDASNENHVSDDGIYLKHTLREVLRDYLKPHWNLRFPITRLVIQLLLLLTLVPLLVGYTIVVLIDLLLGRKASFFKVMHSPRTNMLISLSILTGSLTILVSMFVFFVNDVMLYAPQRDINSKGALTITQSCHREHSIFMFNSASLWADTGIELVEGDVVTISGSGSFESSIWDKVTNALNNSKPRYSLVNIAYDDRNGENNEKSDMRFCLFNDTTDRANPPRFGSLLYQIQTSQRKCVNMNTDTLQPIFQAHLDPISGVLNERFSVRSSGTLFVCVNDIYLTEELVNEMFECYADSSLWRVRAGKSSPLELYLIGHETADTIPDGYIATLRHDLLTLASTPDGRGHWLHDNCGDILLSIKVERNIWSGSTLGPIDKIYSYVFRGLENIISLDKSNSYAFMIFFICMVAWFISDIVIGKVMRRHINNNNKPNDKI